MLERLELSLATCSDILKALHMGKAFLTFLARFPLCRVAKAPTYLTPTTGSDPVFFIIFRNDYALKNQKLNVKPCKK